jgi:hypothetical protein
MGDDRNPACGERPDGMVHCPQEEALQVAEVAGDLEGHDLPPAIRQEFVGAGIAGEDQLAVGRMIAIAHEVLVRAEASDPCGGSRKPLSLLLGERTELLKAADQQMGHGGNPFRAHGMWRNAPSNMQAIRALCG